MNIQQSIGISFATVLTIARIVLAPCIFFAVVVNKPLLAGMFFVIAAATDFFDGFLARSYGQATALGARLDPIADKILVIISLSALLIYVDRLLVPSYVLYFLCLREVLLLIGAWYVYRRCNHQLTIRPTWLGKCTTVLQMACIAWALLSSGVSVTLPPLYYWLYYRVLDVMIICSAGALMQYFGMGYQQLEDYHV